MKKANRLPYLILTKVELPDMELVALCCFCKYARWSGFCDDADIECTHRLSAVNDRCFDMAEKGGDCWGFRPLYHREDCVDMVGIWLQSKTIDFDSLEGK